RVTTTVASTVPIPRALREALEGGQVVPFVGAGVSMAVEDSEHPGQRLFPSWSQVLERAAFRLEEEQRPDDAQAVRSAIRKRTPSSLQAANDARDGLRALWLPFLREVFDPPPKRAVPASLALAAEMWRLGSRLVVTTNYDRVLHWTCPERDDLRYWDI